MSENTELKTNGASIDLVPDTHIKSIWKKIHRQMRSNFGEAVFRSWLKPLKLEAYYYGTMEVSVPTRFMKDWIQNHYSQDILALAQKADPEVTRIEFVVVPTAIQDEDDAAPTAAETTANQNKGSKKRDLISDMEETLASTLDARFTFDSFVVGESNRLAHAAARRVAESEAVPFTPLFLYGGVGLGKTHLMQSIAHKLRERDPERRVLYMSAEKFMYQFIRALRSNDTMSFKEVFRSADVLMIDDIQFICGKESTQEEFFHTFNALVDQGSQIVITADKAPSELPGIDDRLRSRLGWGLVADIQPASEDLRLGILQRKRALMGVDVPDTVLEFLAQSIKSNVRELEGALNRIVAHAEVAGNAVTLDYARSILQDLLRTTDRKLTIDEIQRAVSHYFDITVADMHSARRSRNVARPRQVAMYMVKQLTSRSLPEIGRKFGGRDHTTVMHAVRKVNELIDADPEFAADIEKLHQKLKSGM